MLRPVEIPMPDGGVAVLPLSEWLRCLRILGLPSDTEPSYALLLRMSREIS